MKMAQYITQLKLWDDESHDKNTATTNIYKDYVSKTRD